MVNTCAAYKCNGRDPDGKPIPLHKFPQDSHLKELWINATKRSQFVPGKYTYLCDKHFNKECFNFHFGRRTMKKDAIPTIFIFPPDSGPSKNGRKKLIDLSKTINVASTSKSLANSSNLIEESLNSISFNEVSPSKKIKYCHKRYKNTIELCSSSLSSPIKAKRNWYNAKNKINLQKKKIIALELANSRLIKRVTSLKDLIAKYKIM